MSNLHRTPAHRRLPATLRADCSRCAGLCCVADAFYAIQGFGFDKPARSPCAHLTAHNRCAIHAQRAARGFGACIGFDCHGAGQRLTRDLGIGADWRSSRETAARVFAAYGTYAALHRLMAMLALAETSVAPQLAARARAMRAEIEELCGTEAARRGAIDVEGVRRRVMALVREARPARRAERPR